MDDVLDEHFVVAFEVRPPVHGVLVVFLGIIGTESNDDHVVEALAVDVVDEVLVALRRQHWCVVQECRPAALAVVYDVRAAGTVGPVLESLLQETRPGVSRALADLREVSVCVCVCCVLCVIVLDVWLDVGEFALYLNRFRSKVDARRGTDWLLPRRRRAVLESPMHAMRSASAP